MKVEEFLEKANEMIGISGVELVITETTDNTTYDGINWFKNVLRFDIKHENNVLLSINLDVFGEVKKATWFTVKDRAYAMAQVEILNRLFNGKYNFHIKDN